MALHVRFDEEFLHLLPKPGAVLTKFQYDAKRAAAESTIDKVEKRSGHLKTAAAYCRRLLTRSHPRFNDFKCTRCMGSGKWESPDGHIKGECYACDGKGIGYASDPIFMRRRCVDSILNFISDKNIVKVTEWARKVVDSNELQQPYRAVLIDIADLILIRDFSHIARQVF